MPWRLDKDGNWEYSAEAKADDEEWYDVFAKRRIDKARNELMVDMVVENQDRLEKNWLDQIKPLQDDIVHVEVTTTAPPRREEQPVPIPRYSRPVPAKFPAKCPRCHDWVKVGQMIARAEDVGWKFAHSPSCQEASRTQQSTEERIKDLIKRDADRLRPGPPPPYTPTTVPNAPAPVPQSVQSFKPAEGEKHMDVIDALIDEVIARMPKIEVPPMQVPEVTEEQVGRIAAKILGEAIEKINKPVHVVVRRHDGTDFKVEGPQHRLFPQLLYYITSAPQRLHVGAVTERQVYGRDDGSEGARPPVLLPVAQPADARL